MRTQTPELAHEPTLADFFAALWQTRAAMLMGLVIALLAAAAFLFSATPHHRAEYILAPANPMNGEELSSLMANDNLFALRYIVQRAGVANASDFIKFETMISGAGVAKELLQDEMIVRGLSYDRSFAFLKARPVQTPSELASYIERRVHLESIGSTPMRRMVYYHPHPAFARYFVQQIHSVTDRIIRDNTRSQAAERSAFLQAEINATTNPDHRRAMTALLMEQERMHMLASLEQNYAAAAIEEPSASPQPRWPDIPLTITGFAFAGMISAFIIAQIKLAVINTKGNMSSNVRLWFRSNASNINAPQKAKPQSYYSLGEDKSNKQDTRAA